MKSFLIDAEGGEFIIPGGHYGLRIVPTARRVQRLNPPAGTPGYMTNPFLWGPRYYGTPGEFPVTLTALDMSAESIVLSNSDAFEDSMPMPTYRVAGAEPGSTWRVILRESPTERLVLAPRPELGLLDLDTLEVLAPPSLAATIRLRPCYRKLHLLLQPMGGPADWFLNVLHTNTGSSAAGYYVLVEGYSPANYTSRVLTLDVPASGTLALQGTGFEASYLIKVLATIEVG